jgi:hypothetical protein
MRRYQQNQRTGRRKPVLISVILGVLLTIGASVWIWASQRNDSDEAEDTTQVVEFTDGEQPERVVGRYLFTGSTVPARGIQQQATRADGTIDYYQPFSELHTLEPEKYDAWMTELECPITDRQMTFREQVDTLVFNCLPGFVDPLVEYFELISLANNHSGDLGLEAFEETQQRLDDAGAQIFGHYVPGETADACEVIGLPVRIQSGEEETGGRLPIAFCAWHYFNMSPEPGELEAMLEYVDILPVFAFTHAGAEYFAEAQPPEEELTRAVLDLGAEFIINNNPHWVQNTDVYNDRLIVYSTGNFMFDQLDEETNRAANIDTSIAIRYDENVAAWLELGEKCIGQDDNCLERARELGLEKIEIDYTFDVVASYNGYRELPRKASEQTQAAVEERMNWQQTLRELGQID